MLLHYATRTKDQIYRWTNQKHLKSPKCKLCEKTENIKNTSIMTVNKIKKYGLTSKNITKI